jgi:hypothetical protein
MPLTSIRKTEYHPETRVLSVWFVASGKRYDYEAVPPETYAAFRNAFAKGRFFNDHIRDRFPYRLIGTHSDRWLFAATHAPVSSLTRQQASVRGALVAQENRQDDQDRGRQELRRPVLEDSNQSCASRR